jgi:probable rRNA maturation factor
MPKKFLNNLVAALSKELVTRKVLKSSQRQLELTVVFLNAAAAKKINHSFRKKNYATDVLSFPADAARESALGELILCPQVLQKQAGEHSLSFQEELGYMVIHGVLHLLGYDHEKTEYEAKKMFRLQDEMFGQIFDKIL